jgi:predicted AlkP superfamily pyrophosphatase or phosphodiesterase
MTNNKPLTYIASLLASIASLTAAPRGVLLISVDGLRPDYVTRANLKIPTLRAMMKEGAHATGVRGVLPTVTYSSHTTLVTGAAPAIHGIPTNRPFDPEAKASGIWYWYANEIRVPTLWQAAADAGYVTGSVSWPVTVGADAIRYNVPEYARTRDADDLKMVRGLTTPGLYAELEKKVGPYTTDINHAIPRDWVRTRWAAEMIRAKRIRFMTIHLASTDHAQHEHGPFTPSAFEALEAVDKMIGVLKEAILSVDPNAVVCIVSDHGFSTVNHHLKLSSAFVKEGLITLKSQRDTLQASGIADWKAMPWESGGSAAVVLKDRNDEATRAGVAKFLDRLASDPANGIARILDRKAIAKFGGSPIADFWIDMRSGFAFSASLTEPLVIKVSPRGTHGYAPDNPELMSFFLMAGSGIRKGVDVGEIDMRSIAPTIAKVLGVKLPAADLAPVNIEE